MSNTHHLRIGLILFLATLISCTSNNTSSSKPQVEDFDSKSTGILSRDVESTDLIDNSRVNEKTEITMDDIYGSWDVYYFEFGGKSQDTEIKLGGNLILQPNHYIFEPNENVNQMHLDTIGQGFSFIQDKEGKLECDLLLEVGSNPLNGDVVAICSFINESQSQKFNIIFFEDENENYFTLREVIEPGQVVRPLEIRKLLAEGGSSE